MINDLSHNMKESQKDKNKDKDKKTNNEDLVVEIEDTTSEE